MEDLGKVTQYSGVQTIGFTVRVERKPSMMNQGPEYRIAMAFRDLRFVSNRGEGEVLSRSVYQRKRANGLVHRRNQIIALLGGCRLPVQNPFSLFLPQFLETERARFGRGGLQSRFSRFSHEQPSLLLLA
jgi:hypothetical protein